MTQQFHSEAHAQQNAYTFTQRCRLAWSQQYYPRELTTGNHSNAQQGGMNTCSTVTRYNTDKLRKHNVEQKSHIRENTPCDSLYRRCKQAKPSCAVRNRRRESPLARGKGPREGHSGVLVRFYFLIPVLVTRCVRLVTVRCSVFVNYCMCTFSSVCSICQ